MELLDAARQAAAGSVNALMTTSYWEIGRRIVEAEQKGRRRAGYGEQLMARLSAGLTARFGRGFSPDNLENMRRFFAAYPLRQFPRRCLGNLTSPNWPWSSRCCGRPMSGCWRSRMTIPVGFTRPRRCAVRQLEWQIGSHFYERTAKA